MVLGGGRFLINEVPLYGPLAILSAAFFRRTLMVWLLGSRVQGPGFRAQGSGFRVQGSGLRDQGSERSITGSS